MREQLTGSLSRRREALIDLIDALSSNQHATSVAELSLNPLFQIDATPYPRPYSATLPDKTFIHYPNPIKGNKPISIGHTYSVVCALPERTETGNVPWSIFLSYLDDWDRGT